jgi:hypothetical protein
MATYKLLQDHTLPPNGAYALAGTVVTMPDNWVPSGNCEPLDQAALTAFINAGPQQLGLVRQQWSGQFVTPPKTYWKPATSGIWSGSSFWQLVVGLR